MALIKREDLVEKLCEIPGYLDEEREPLIPLRDVRKLISLMPTVEKPEPRVLSLEELEGLQSDEDYSVPVCVEELYPLDRWDGGSFCKWCSAAFVQEEYLDDNKYYNPYTYNATWRAWTSWPTKRQREETPWQK